MKTIYLMRHAKSSWNHPELEDHERPLNVRGLRDAPAMGRRLLRLDVIPDLLLTSTAVRARDTAEAVAREIGYPIPYIRALPELYHATGSQIVEIISAQENEASTIMLVGHNPAITEAAGRLTGTQVEWMPTCSVLCAVVDTHRWDDFASAGNASIKHRLQPKNAAP